MNSPSCLFIFLVAISVAIDPASAAIPTCFITIAGRQKFGVFAPYDNIEWRDIKEDGTWGEDTLVKMPNLNKLEVKLKVTQPANEKFVVPYDPSANCVRPGSLRKLLKTVPTRREELDPIDSPRTYLIVHPGIPTFRVKSGKLTSDKGYHYSMMNHESNFLLKGGFYDATEAKKFEYAGFYYDMRRNNLRFVQYGGKFSVEKKGDISLFYGIFQRPDEFLIPGAYTEQKILGKVDSPKECIELARTHRIEGIELAVKGISYQYATKKCYYSNKQGDAPGQQMGWTSAAVNFRHLPTCYITLAGARITSVFAPYAHGQWRSMARDFLFGPDTLTKIPNRNALELKLKYNDTPKSRIMVVEYDPAKNCAKTGSLRKIDWSNPNRRDEFRRDEFNYFEKPRTYVIAHPGIPPFIIRFGRLTSDKGYVNSAGVKMYGLDKLIKNGFYDPTTKNSQYSGFSYDDKNSKLFFLPNGGKFSIDYLNKNFFGHFQKKSEIYVPGVYTERIFLGKASGWLGSCLELARKYTLSPIKGISFHRGTENCYYSNKEGDSVTPGEEMGWAANWTSRAVNLHPVPTCFITIAGRQKFGVFAPYSNSEWRDIKEDGTWGQDTLVKLPYRNNVVLKLNGVTAMTKETTPVPGLFSYDLATYCITVGDMKKSDGENDWPRTYAIIHPGIPTFRTKSKGVLTSDKGYLNSPGVDMVHFSQFFKDGFYDPKKQASHRQYAGFYWHYGKEKLLFVENGGKLSIEKKEGEKEDYHFYGIFQKASEFLIPGAYTEQNMLGKVDSPKECIELAKRRTLDLKSVKAVSYQSETKNCYYSNKEGDTRGKEWGWTSAAVNYVDVPECYLYAVSLPDNLHDAYAPWGPKEWRSVNNDDAWSDHYIREEYGIFNMFKEDGSKLFDVPITHTDGLAWDSSAKCLKKNAQITGQKNKVYLYSQTEFGVYLSTEQLNKDNDHEGGHDFRYDSDFVANLQDRFDTEYRDAYFAAVSFDEKRPHKFSRYNLYVPGPATKGVLTLRFARPQRQTPQPPTFDDSATETAV